MTSNNMDVEPPVLAIVDQLLDGTTVVVDRVAWERLNPDPTPDRTDGAWAYFGEVARAHTLKLGAPRVWAGDHWGTADEAEEYALDMLRAVAWARQEAKS